MRNREWLYTFAVFAVSFLLLSLWAYPMIHPFAWGELNVCAGLRPPSNAFHGAYRGICFSLFSCFPVKTVLGIVPWLSHAAIALAAAGIYSIFRDILPPVMRVDPHFGRIIMTASRGIAAMTAILFLCVDPIWRAGQAFTPTTVFIFTGVAAAWLFFRFLTRASILALYLSFVMLGVLSAENLLGVVLTAAAAGYLAIVVTFDPTLGKINDELVWNVTAKRLSYVWLFVLSVTLGLGIWFFCAHNGMACADCAGMVDFVVFFLRGAWAEVVAVAGFDGWSFGLAACVMPYVIAAFMVRRSWKDDSFLPYIVGMVFAVIAFVALCQIAAVNPFWEGISARQAELVPSEPLRALFLVFNISAFTLAMSVFAVDVCCRNYRQIAKWRFPDSVEQPEPAAFARALGKGRRRRKLVFWAILFVLPLFAIPGRFQPAERAILTVMRDYVREILDEVGDRGTIFTDGSFDCYLELLSAAEGKSLVALSMMEPATSYAAEVRYRAVENDEDKALLKNDAAAALRTWVEAKAPRLDRCAVQLGFEFWKRFEQAMPAFSGVVALPGETDLDALKNGIDVALALSERLLEISDKFDAEELADRELKRIYPFMLWRLARIARMRSYQDAKEKRYNESVRETELAEKLDAVNHELKALNLRNRWLNIQNGGALTPREGLVIGLARADFNLAAYYAEPVLRADPDDSRANFAMGMKSYFNEEYVRAERYFLTCLKSKPDEPAALNNLANTELKLGKFDEAREYAEKALKRLPDNAEILRTISRIKELSAKAEKEKKE